ncbi:MAG: hypothetical protein JWQ89_2245 [Devosia sp.]|uniref:DUF2793 domain-containing protein n=1 Tax=Devosia sp. TaxID=1871048 RepID=UPI00262B1AAC|nr:DUF2793 domain-containing protein [Devosia sp.]MDB5540518.1 hypothetical protein [Devosia sp.]
MAQNPIRTAAAATAGLVTGTLLEAMVKRFGYVLNVGESLVDLDFDVGEPPLLIHYAATGYDYFLDTTDSTTADDGLTCLVSGNGLRYHIEEAAAISRNSVLSIATAPPGSPVVGDVYRVGTAATGAFAGRDDDLAVYTRRGWVYAAPEIGLTVFNEDTGTNQQFTASGWTGFAVEYADGSVPPRALLMAAGVAVEETLNTPPGSPAADTFWLVGTVPTGAFVGHAGDIAYYESAAWAFIDAYEGATVFHRDFGFEVSYVGGAWLGGAGSDYQDFSTAGASTWTKPSKGNVALIQCWGAGGSGRRGSNGNGGGGGGGGAYVERLVPLSSLGATETVTVGAGGAARTVDSTDGQAGGNTSLGSHVVAYGGGGGVGTTGGGGGGQKSASSAGAGGSPIGGASGSPGVASVFGGGGGGSGTGAGGESVSGGGGGGGGATSSLQGGAGGGSMRGGGGGGGGGNTPGNIGGVSTHGGNGGAGADGGGVAATAGAQPGGGGGGNEAGNSGKGGDGRVRVTVW